MVHSVLEIKPFSFHLASPERDFIVESFHLPLEALDLAELLPDRLGALACSSINCWRRAWSSLNVFG